MFYHIARAQATKEIVRKLLSDDAAKKKIEAVPFSDNSVSRRIGEMAQDISAQLLEQVRASEYFALQLDENLDLSNAAQLLVYIRFIAPERSGNTIL